MGIVARVPERQFAPAPEGLHLAVCCDVVDLGVQRTPWGESHKVDIRWQLEAVDPERGRPFEVLKRYRLSLHAKAALRKDLETWRGRKFTEEELKGFDLERLIGANCQVQVMHTTTGEGDAFAAVQTIIPPPSGTPKLTVRDYVRKKDRAPNGRGPEITADDIPF